MTAWKCHNVTCFKYQMNSRLLQFRKSSSAYCTRPKGRQASSVHLEALLAWRLLQSTFGSSCIAFWTKWTGKPRVAENFLLSFHCKGYKYFYSFSSPHKQKCKCRILYVQNMFQKSLCVFSILMEVRIMGHRTMGRVCVKWTDGCKSYLWD